MRTAPRPEPVAEPEEIFLVDRVQYGGGSPLYNLILKSRHIRSKLHFDSVSLWDRLKLLIPFIRSVVRGLLS
jgi:hypothetical protein